MNFRLNFASWVACSARTDGVRFFLQANYGRSVPQARVYRNCGSPFRRNALRKRTRSGCSIWGVGRDQPLPTVDAPHVCSPSPAVVTGRHRAEVGNGGAQSDGGRREITKTIRTSTASHPAAGCEPADPAGPPAGAISSCLIACSRDSFGACTLKGLRDTHVDDVLQFFGDDATLRDADLTRIYLHPPGCTGWVVYAKGAFSRQTT